MDRLQNSCGEIVDLFSTGTRVRHKKTGLVGTIICYEYHESGKISPMPYKVYWDDSAKACEELGWFYLYPCIDEIEEVK